MPRKEMLAFDEAEFSELPGLYGTSIMRCKKCRHNDANPMGKCTAEVIEKNVEVIGLDGKKYIEPVMYDICACKEKVHYEAVKGFPVPDHLKKQ